MPVRALLDSECAHGRTQHGLSKGVERSVALVSGVLRYVASGGGIRRGWCEVGEEDEWRKDVSRSVLGTAGLRGMKNLRPRSGVRGTCA